MSGWLINLESYLKDKKMIRVVKILNTNDRDSKYCSSSK